MVNHKSKKAEKMGPPCNRCGEEMRPHSTKMFGASWKCSSCGTAYRILPSEVDLFKSIAKE